MYGYGPILPKWLKMEVASLLAVQKTGAPHLKFNVPMAALRMSFAMAPNLKQIVDFSPWYGDSEFGEHVFEVGAISYGADGVFRLSLASADSVQAELIFQAPLATRIVQEGSLMDYWNSGFIVRNHNLFVATRSQFLSWLEHSSSGVHSVDRVRHYAIFTDDVCVEVLSSEAPKIHLNCPADSA